MVRHASIETVDPQGDYGTFRIRAAELIDRGLAPDQVSWTDAASEPPSLFAAGDEPSADAAGGGQQTDSGPVHAAMTLEHPAVERITRRLGSKGESAAHHSDPRRWATLYRLAWRVGRGGEPGILGDPLDPDVRAMERLARQVRFDVHKMKAFVRFQRVQDATDERYVAWHRSDHRIMRLAAPFFARRFGSMRWTIFSADESADWDGERLRFGEGVPADQVQQEDELEDLWRTYYASIFNPARIKLQMMTREMPVRFCDTLPEARIIERLVADAPARVRRMIIEGNTDAGAEAFLPGGDVPLPVLHAELNNCAGCSIGEMATRAVPGEGPAAARLMFVGEQPGDEEDRAGRPFVGPAGRMFDSALARAGIDRADVYVTNAVKHFKYEPRGKRRIHSRASASEVRACRPWLVREIGLVDPDVIVLLGATAGQSIFGAGYRVRGARSTWMEHPRFRGRFFGTVHPSLLIRMPESQRASAVDTFVKDLRTAADDGRPRPSA